MRLQGGMWGNAESHGRGGRRREQMEAALGACDQLRKMAVRRYAGSRRLLLLLRAEVPLHKYRKPRTPNAHYHGNKPLLPCHTGKLEYYGVNPAHGNLAGRPSVEGEGSNRKAWQVRREAL